MAQDVVIRMDEALSLQFGKVCDEIGLPISAAFLIFAKRVVRDRKIPFELSADPDPFYSESNMAHIRRGIAAFKAGKFAKHDLIEVEDDGEVLV